MAVTSSIKQNDSSPAFTATLRDGDGDVVDLTNATARFLMRNRRTREQKVAAAASVTDESGGRISYQWLAGDTDTPGVFQVEIEVTFSDETVATFPSDGYHQLTILAEIN